MGNEFSEECIVSIITVTRISEVGTLAVTNTVKVVPGTSIFVTVMIEEIRN
jgi:hypothetical protein